MWALYISIPTIGFVIGSFVAGTSKTDYDIVTPFISLGIFLISVALSFGLFIGRLIK
jgi:hypothetical protein